MDIKNIIFDLGGVLLNLDYNETIKSFKDLGMKNFEEFFTQVKQTDLFDRMDMGKATPEEFRDELRRISGFDMSDAMIDKAWNAMLLDFPQHKLPMLEQIRNNYRIFLLSNTNAIHYPAYSRYLQDAHGYENLGKIFEKEYISYEIGLRKPDPEIYYYVMAQNNLLPHETLFFDDTPGHVEGARKAGLHAYWIDTANEDITEFFEKGKLKDSFFAKLQNQYELSGQ
jgi:glucose-1-phosphatase